MALRGSSFSINTSNLDGVLSNVIKSKDRIDKLTEKKISKAVDIMYKIATARRPMISKQQMKSEGRTKRVSDAGAELGVPVQTGALLASIQKSVTNNSKGIVGRIWTNLFYAPYVEFGTSRMQARPFMRPAINLTREAIKQLFGKQDA